MRQDILLDLADSALLAENSLSKAHTLCQELCEHYFQYHDIPIRQTCGPDDLPSNFILWEYNHYAVYAHIIQDYLVQAEAGVAGLSLILHDYLKHNSDTPHSYHPTGTSSI